jgi:hypothetical protein
MLFMVNEMKIPQNEACCKSGRADVREITENTTLNHTHTHTHTDTSSKSNNRIIDHLANLRPVQFIGDISYSLYLWHWVVIATVPLVWIDGFSTAKDKVLIFVPLSFVLATLSYYFVEQIFRKSRKNKLLLTYLVPALCSVLLIMFGVHFYLNSNDKAADTIEYSYQSAYRAVNAEYAYETALNSNGDDSTASALQAIEDAGYSKGDLCLGAIAIEHQDLCGDVFGGTLQNTEDRRTYKIINPRIYQLLCSTGELNMREYMHTCVLGDASAERYILIVGDSHMQVLAPTIDSIGKRYGYKVLGVIGQGRQAPTMSPELTKHPDFAQKRQDYILDLERNAAVTIVSINTRAEDGNGLVRLLSKFTHKPIMIEDFPGAHEKQTSCVEFGNDCVVKYSEYDSDLDVQAEALRDFPHLFTLIPMKSRYCNTVGCALIIGGIPVARDNSHITVSYSITLTPYLDKQLRPFLEVG